MSSNKFIIEKIKGREIIDSRGNPTVEAEIYTLGDLSAYASVPSGASTGRFEALELRDEDPQRMHGRGVLKAVRIIEDIISPKLKGVDVRNQREIDQIMITLDGTPQKSKLGGNTILSVSLAAAKTASKASGKELFEYLAPDKEVYVLPVPLMNIINGGKHAGNQLSFQEFMIVPAGFKAFSNALEAGVTIYQSLKKLLLSKYGKNAINVGDEGGFAPNISETEEALQLLIDSIESSGYQAGKEVFLALDCAASEIYEEKSSKYLVDGRRYGPNELLDLFISLTEKYPIISIEDPFEENDFTSFATITKKLGSKVQIVGDDLFVTNIERLKRGIQIGAANALLLKVNQIGSLSEALDAANLALSNNYNVIVSHRSGETEDTYIADIAVALCVGEIKTGAPARGERTAKYNRLLRIEEKLGDKCTFKGITVFHRD